MFFSIWSISDMLSALLKLAVTSFLMQNMKIPPLFKAHKFSAPRGSAPPRSRSPRLRINSKL